MTTFQQNTKDFSIPSAHQCHNLDSDYLHRLGLVDVATATAMRIFIVAPFTWLYYRNIYNPIKLFWHKCLPEDFKEFIRRLLGWRTWAEHEASQRELNKRYES